MAINVKTDASRFNLFGTYLRAGAGEFDAPDVASSSSNVGTYSDDGVMTALLLELSSSGPRALPQLVAQTSVPLSQVLSNLDDMRRYGLVVQEEGNDNSPLFAITDAGRQIALSNATRIRR